MKKKSFISLLLASVLLLCSCGKGVGRMVIFDDSNKKAAIRMEQILEALKNKDRDTLKAMFSKQALVEASDFDGNMEYLFDFFQGNVEIKEKERFTSEIINEQGEKSIMLIYWYTVTTDKHNYKFFVIDYTKNTINPDYVGLYTLRVIKAEDEETQFTFWDDMKIAGIYKPE